MYIANAKMNPTAAPAGLSVPGVPPTAAEMAIVGFIVIVGLYFGQVVFVPLALAVILSFVLAPAVRLLKRTGLPNSPAVVLVVMFAFALIFGVGALITQQVGSLAQDLPRYQVTLKDKVAALRDATSGGGGAFKQASEALKDLQEQLEAPTKAAAPPVSVTVTPLPGPLRDGGGKGKPIPVEVHTPAPTPLDQLQSIIGIILHPLATTGATLLFVLFLLMQREDVRDRAIRLLGSHDLEKSTTAMDDAGTRLSRYFLAMTGINAAFGVVIGVGLWMIGVPSPVLWGVLAMLMRFVPFIGAFIAAAFPLLLAAAVDPGWGMFLWTLALYLIAEPIMGSLIEPIVQGQRTGLSPLAVILSAAFWTLLWGPIGLLLAIPLTVVLVVLGRHVERLEFLNVILGDTPPLSPPERFYQRMLAGDPAEAVEQAEKFIKERPLVDYYDEVVIEALRLAQADADRGTLEPARLDDIRDTSDIVIDALADQDVVPKPQKKRPLLDLDLDEDAKDAAKEEEDDEEDEREISEPAEIALADAWKQPNAVLCVASRTALDETVALALARLLQKYGIGTKVIDAQHLRHGTLAAEDREGVQLICVSALDVRERSAHARFLVRRLKRSAPDTPVLGGFWQLDTESAADAAIINSVAVDATATTLREAIRYCLDTARADSARSAAEQVETMRVESPNLPVETRAAS
ncbi:MAG: AI-2E family transporter [Hyphomicrobium sp.]|jgi:predicted PurR-regulated permease PerM